MEVAGEIDLIRPGFNNQAVFGPAFGQLWVAAVAVVFGFGMLICNLTQKPFFTEFIPPDIIGQVSGTYNICFAVGRTIAAAGGGALIKWLGGDYRMIFPIAFGAGVIAAIIAMTLRDPRFEAQRLAGKAAEVTS